MHEITLDEMLSERERRALFQDELIEKYGRPVICFTMNIPGPVKNSPLIERGFFEGLSALDHRLPKGSVLFKTIWNSPAGPAAFYALDYDALHIKAICTAIEDGSPLGRLFDMDVIDEGGGKLDRSLVGGKDRGCIVCGAPGRGCASRRIHPAHELQKAAFGIIDAHFAGKDAEITASIAVSALLDEVCTAPKPGLVDRFGSGSHSDMDIFTFTKSASALYPYFEACHHIGRKTADKPHSETFALLREEGLRAEERMLSFTDGVNTHKGAIYTLGLLCGAAGRLHRSEHPQTNADMLMDECALLAGDAVKKDFCELSEKNIQTFGEKLYVDLGITGIRGEVSHGLPSVRNISLPVFRHLISEGLSRNDAGAITLLHLISRITDTNILRRGGTEGALFASSMAGRLIEKDRLPSMDSVFELGEQFEERNLSPGGCADLLAVTYFLCDIEKYYLNA